MAFRNRFRSRSLSRLSSLSLSRFPVNSLNLSRSPDNSLNSSLSKPNLIPFKLLRTAQSTGPPTTTTTTCRWTLPWTTTPQSSLRWNPSSLESESPSRPG